MVLGERGGGRDGRSAEKGGCSPGVLKKKKKKITTEGRGAV